MSKYSFVDAFLEGTFEGKGLKVYLFALLNKYGLRAYTRYEFKI
jgi:hypothetical protein